MHTVMKQSRISSGQLVNYVNNPPSNFTELCNDDITTATYYINYCYVLIVISSDKEVIFYPAFAFLLDSVC